MRLKFNMNDVPDGGFRVLDSGVYLAKLADVKEDESASGNPMLVWDWEVLDNGGEGTTLKSFTSLLDHALFGLKNHLEAFGIKDEVDMDTDSLIGKKAKLVVIKTTTKNRKTGDDMPTNRIEEVRSAGKSTASVGSGKSKVGGKSVISNKADDDIPF